MQQKQKNVYFPTHSLNYFTRLIYLVRPIFLVALNVTPDYRAASSDFRHVYVLFRLASCLLRAFPTYSGLLTRITLASPAYYPAAYDTGM